MAEAKRDGVDASPYPLFIRLSGQKVLVVGGGLVAERKVQTLLEHGARVTVVSPKVTGSLRSLAAAESISWIGRCWEPDDGDGALLVIAATGVDGVDEAVYAEAEARHQLVNVVDVPHLCTAIVPSVVKRGRLQIAISTSGASPSTARELRRQLEALFPAYWEDYLDLMAELRLLVKSRVPGPMERRAPLYEAIQAGDLLERVASGERPAAEEVYGRVVAPLLEGGGL